MKPNCFIPQSVSYVDWGNPVFANPDPNRPVTSNKTIEGNMKTGLQRGEVALFASQFACFATAEQTGVAFAENPNHRLGRDMSRYGVKFGALTVSSEVVPQVTTYVAVKPYDKRIYNRDGDRNPENMEVAPATSLVHDWATSNLLNKLSSSTAYKPLGIWKLNDPFFVPALVTEFHERSVSFDNVIRENTEVVGEVTDMKLRHIINLGYFGLGFLHGAGLVYRDGIPQNFALDGSRVIINDVTSIRALNGKNDPQKVTTDVFDFVDGIFDLSPSERIHGMATSALNDPSYRKQLFDERYVSGFALGSQRSGGSPPMLIGRDDFHTVIGTVSQKYS